MSFVRDLRVAAHSLIRTPGLAFAVVLTLALGIGGERCHFHAGARSAAQASGQSRRGPADLYPARRSRHRRRKRCVFRTRVTGLARERENRERLWRLLDHGLHHDRSR